jgi:hypothetical protein
MAVATIENCLEVGHQVEHFAQQVDVGRTGIATRSRARKASARFRAPRCWSSWFVQAAVTNERCEQKKGAEAPGSLKDERDVTADRAGNQA